MRPTDSARDGVVLQVKRASDSILALEFDLAALLRPCLDARAEWGLRDFQSACVRHPDLFPAAVRTAGVPVLRAVDTEQPVRRAIAVGANRHHGEGVAVTRPPHVALLRELPWSNVRGAN